MWRLADSIPKTKLERWRAERQLWLADQSEPLSADADREFHELFSREIDALLDRGVGSCVLRNPDVARIVADALDHFDGEQYRISTYVVMPNHVHVLFRPYPGFETPNIIQAWKSVSA